MRGKHYVLHNIDLSGEWYELRNACGLNADWNSAAVHLGPSTKPNWRDGDFYIVEDEQTLVLCVRNYSDDSDTITEVRTAPLTPEGFNILVRQYQKHARLS